MIASKRENPPHLRNPVFAVLIVGLGLLFGVHALSTGIAWASASGSVSQEELADALGAALDNDASYRNALYLFLRIAGIFWIAVEWVAAIVLWKAHRLFVAALDRERVQC